MKQPRKLTITPLQRLGKRVDSLESDVKGVATRVDALALRLQNLSKQVSETLHIGNYEAMYRLEREENIKLRAQQNGHHPEIETTFVEGWIAQLECLVHQLRGTISFDGQVNEKLLIDETSPLTADEQKIVMKFGDELRRGLKP